MSTNTVERTAEVCALDGATLCEAFQISAAAHPQRVALRTPGNAVVLTWAQYAERVRRTAAGLAALGVRRGDTVALMLSNRPEFHWVDAAAMHLGAATFGVYNTFAQDQVDYVLRDARRCGGRHRAGVRLDAAAGPAGLPAVDPSRVCRWR